MGRPNPMQADQSDPLQEELDQYEHPLEADTTYGEDTGDEYPKEEANYQDPSAETNNMMNEQQQYPPAQNPAPRQYPPPQQNVNVPGRSYPPQAQQQPQMYAPPQQNVNVPAGRSYPPQAQQQPQMYQPPAGNYPPQQQQQQQYQGPVQFPPTRPPPPVPVSPSPIKPDQQFNGSTTQGFPIQQPQIYQPGTPNMVSSHMPKVNGTNAWSTGLFDCMEDPQNAFITAVFPCLTFGQIAEIIDNGHTTCGTSGIMYGAIGFCIAMPCLLSCTYRTKLRNQFDLVEAPAPDWATHFLCELCALCQAYRELKNRGLDPSIGWHGNQMRRQQQPVMMAPMNQSMMQ